MTIVYNVLLLMQVESKPAKQRRNTKLVQEKEIIYVLGKRSIEDKFVGHGALYYAIASSYHRPLLVVQTGC